jgi:hypothetical protein
MFVADVPQLRVRHAFTGEVLFEGPRPATLKLLKAALAVVMGVQSHATVRVLCGDLQLRAEADFAPRCDGDAELAALLVGGVLRLAEELLEELRSFRFLRFPEEYAPVFDDEEAMLALLEEHPQLLREASQRLRNDEAFLRQAVARVRAEDDALYLMTRLAAAAAKPGSRAGTAD